MSKVLGALVAAAALVALTGCAAPMPPTPASPSPGQSPERPHRVRVPSPTPVPTSQGTTYWAAITALPGWSYDALVSPRDAIGLPHPSHLVGDRVRRARSACVWWAWIRSAFGTARSSSGTECGGTPARQRRRPADSSRGRRPQRCRGRLGTSAPSVTRALLRRYNAWTRPSVPFKPARSAREKRSSSTPCRRRSSRRPWRI